MRTKVEPKSSFLADPHAGLHLFPAAADDFCASNLSVVWYPLAEIIDPVFSLALGWSGCLHGALLLLSPVCGAKLLGVSLGWCLHVLQCSSEQKYLKGCEEPRAWPEWQGTASSTLKGRLCLSTQLLPMSAIQCLYLTYFQLLKKTNLLLLSCMVTSFKVFLSCTFLN